MSKKDTYLATIPFRVKNIPCLIGVVNYTHVKGSFSYDAPSDLDYTGYTECDWEILDRKGYKADWLYRKGVDTDLLNEAVADYFREMKDDCY